MTFWADEERCSWASLSSVCLVVPPVYRMTKTICTGLGTAMCGLAPSMEALIVARAVAGMGGGGSVDEHRSFHENSS